MAVAAVAIWARMAILGFDLDGSSPVSHAWMRKNEHHLKAKRRELAKWRREWDKGLWQRVAAARAAAAAAAAAAAEQQVKVSPHK